MTEENVKQEEMHPVEQLEQDINQAETQPEQETQQEQDDREKNLNALREKWKSAERERDEAIQYIKRMEEQRQQEMQRYQQKQEPAEPEVSWTEDDLLEGRHLSAFEKKIMGELQKTREEFSSYKQKSYEETLETQLKMQHPDLMDVLAPENVTALRNMDPDLAESLASNPNLRQKTLATYKAIKRFGIGQDKKYDSEKARVQENTSKPRASASIAPQSDSPLSKAAGFKNGSTPEARRLLYEDMRKKASGAY